MAGAIWLGAVAMLLAGWQPGTYLGLEARLDVAADHPAIGGWRRLCSGISGGWWRWRFCRLLLYLVVADALAINSGTWTIAPAQSTGVMLGGVLPLEELIFFGLTNVLVVFGMTLFLAIDKAYLKRLVGRPQPAGASNVN